VRENKFDQNYSLILSNVSKSYRIYDSSVQRLLDIVAGRGRYSIYRALDSVSLELKKGDCLGIMGDNGAGKSTLLKLVAGTLQCTTGRVETNGRVTAILELGAGFHPDFTGRDNLRFAGSLIGYSKNEISSLEKEIIEFSGLSESIDRPVKTYSSGMVVRLAFSLVTAIRPDILIIDEALAVGDQNFQKKCSERIDEFRKTGCTILLCSHSLYHIRQLCGRALWLDGGSIKAFGETEYVLASYESHIRSREAGTIIRKQSVLSRNEQSDKPPVQETKSVSIKAGISSVSIKSLSSDGLVLESKDLSITITAMVSGGEHPSFGVMLERADYVGVTSVATHADGAKPRMLADDTWEIELCFPDLPLHTGEYIISAYLFDADGLIVYDEWFRYLRFTFLNPSKTPGLVRLPHKWC
jgi:lipopolysaccharide transport system ATP-binding protein